VGCQRHGLSGGSALIATALLLAAPPALASRERALPPADCEALSKLRAPALDLEVTAHIAPGLFEAPDGQRHAVPAFCRVSGVIRPTRGSHIGFELWMPSGGWNGRYYQLGNGGFAGRIHYPSLAAELRRLNAVAATDTGHRGSPFDASWALGQPERIVDFGYRSVQATSAAARALMRAYYRAPARHHYFVGCSNGGRQALMAVQRYPRNWDGVIAGAPAYDWIRQLTATAFIQQTLRRDAASFISAAKLPAIQRAALASCTPSARIVEGVPTDPRHCPFDADTLACAGEESDSCLTAAQLEALRTIHQGLVDPATGQRLLHGFEPSGATVEGHWARFIVNAEPRPEAHLAFAEQFFRNMVFDDPAWSIERLDAVRDLAVANDRRIGNQTLGQVLEARRTNLAAFASRGAKLIMYIGWADALLSPGAALEYYHGVIEHAGGIERAREFSRLFVVPGMAHCQGGPAPSAFGQAGVVPALYDDAKHDLRRALEAWVENAAAPDQIVAAKYVDDNPTHGVVATRQLCAYPKIGEC
jgi:hypothetical protein